MFYLNFKNYWNKQRVRNSPRAELFVYRFLLAIFGIGIVVVIFTPFDAKNIFTSQKFASYSYVLEIKKTLDQSFLLPKSSDNYIDNMNECSKYSTLNDNNIPYIKSNECNFIKIIDVFAKEYDNDENLENTNLTTN